MIRALVSKVINVQVRYPTRIANFPLNPADKNEYLIPMIRKVRQHGRGDRHHPHIKLASRKVRSLNFNP